MLEEEDSVKAEVKISNLPDLACFTSFGDLLLALPTFLSVFVSRSISNVLVGNTEPSASQRSFVWIKRNNAGTVLGVFLFSNGAWNQFFPIPGQVSTVSGATADSTNPPVGYITTDDATTLTIAQKVFFKAQWRDNGSGVFDVYTVVPEGS